MSVSFCCLPFCDGDADECCDGEDPEQCVLPLRISTAAPVRDWEPSRVTLIGDAIHAMSPVLAMGANTAMRDASELTRTLCEARSPHASLVEAVADYQAEMAAYAFPLVANSRETGRTRVGQA
ncbi:hypothetical protein EEB13_07825 [Rhodococcus sp. WS3]|nr:FAD-dependent monooxygenase [Rhodococcus globerulus]ROZ49777.1 hypothetical protein EEB13_07825 [Rhodococcus sp. WS3]